MNVNGLLKAIGAVLVSLAALAHTPAMAQGKVEVLWLGQAAFKITTPGGKVPRMSPIFLRTWYQTSATSEALDESLI